MERKESTADTSVGSSSFMIQRLNERQERVSGITIKVISNDFVTNKNCPSIVVMQCKCFCCR